MAGQGLTWAQFNRSGRYENNLREIHKKSVAGSPLLLVEPVSGLEGSGIHLTFDEMIFTVGKVEFQFNPSDYTEDEFVQKVTARVPDSMKKVSITFTHGQKKVGSGKVLKGPEFGGKPPAGATLTARWGYLATLTEILDPSYKLDTPSSQEMGELMFINDMNTAIAEAIDKELADPKSTMDKDCPGITVKVGSHEFEHVVGVNKVAGTPKADLALVACVNKKLKNVGFLSHKMGSKAKDFGQWSGLTLKAGRVISDHPEVVRFIADVKAWTEANPEWAKPSGVAVRREIQDRDLMMYAVYGPDFGKKFGTENVHAVLQGNPKLNKQGKVYVMTASHVNDNGDDLTGDFIPALVAMKKGAWEKILDPNAKGVRSDFGIRGMRISIYTYGGRKITDEI